MNVEIQTQSGEKTWSIFATLVGRNSATDEMTLWSSLLGEGQQSFHRGDPCQRISGATKNNMTLEKAPTTNTELYLNQIYPATLLMGEINAAFERDEKNAEAGGWSYFCDPEEGNVSEQTARRLAYEGKPVYLQIDANYWHHSSEGGRRGKVGIEDNKEAWSILRQLSLEEESTGDADGYGIVVYRVNFNKLS